LAGAVERDGTARLIENTVGTLWVQFEKREMPAPIERLRQGNELTEAHHLGTSSGAERKRRELRTLRIIQER
jgi:hypothetical protein